MRATSSSSSSSAATPITRAARPSKYSVLRSAVAAAHPAAPSVKRGRRGSSSATSDEEELVDGARPSRRPRRDSNSSLSSGSESAADDGGASDTVATPDFGGSSGEAEHRSRADQASSSSSSSSSEESSNEEEEAFDPYLFIKNLQSTPYGDITGGIDARICLPRKTRSAPSISLVLDLDETLVHCSVEPIAKADLTFAVPCMDGQILTVQVCQRPHLLEFLTQVAQWFEIIVFTASQRVYAEKLLNLLDPERKLIRHRLYRDSCLLVRGNGHGNYVKDLNVLGRDLSKVVIVDNSPHAFGLQPANGIPIGAWYDDAGDCELLDLLPFLEELATTQPPVVDVRPYLRSEFGVHTLIEQAQRKPPRGGGGSGGAAAAAAART